MSELHFALITRTALQGILTGDSIHTVTIDYIYIYIWVCVCMCACVHGGEHYETNGAALLNC